MTGAEPSPRRRAARLALALLAVALVAAVAGYLFGRTDPRRAAGLVVRNFAVAEPVGTATAGPAPSSGTAPAAPRCGLADTPVGVDGQVGALRAGIVLVQYRADAPPDPLVDWAGERRSEVLLAPNPDLEAAVVATAWGRRMRLDEPSTELLTAFTTAYGGQAPDPRPCDHP